jgi:hypothetical protein
MVALIFVEAVDMLALILAREIYRGMSSEKRNSGM